MSVATSNRPAKVKLTNAQEAIASAALDIERTRKLQDWISWAAREVEPNLPTDCMLSDYHWHWSEGNIEITIKPNPDRQWKGLDGTAGLIVKLRKQFNVKKFERYVTTYPNFVQNTYHSDGIIGDVPVHLTVKTGDLPPNCKLEYVEEVVEATTRKVAKVTCARSL